MSGVGEADPASPRDADPSADAAGPSVDAAAAPPADVEAPTPPAKPAKPERQRPAHVVPSGSDAASGPGVPAFVAAVHARDAAAARAAISPAFQGKANGRPMDGDAQVRLLESFWTGFPDGNFAMEATGGSGRYVVTWTFQGTHGGMYLGVPPTGTPVAFSGFIVAVADKGGVTSLDWKWDTKVFTRAVLGPDQVGDLEVKDTFRDPSRRWQNDGRGHGRGPGQGKRKKGKGRPGQQQGGRPQGQGRPQGEPGQGGEPGQPGQADQAGEPGQAVAGQAGAPGQQRQRRPKKPREPRPVQSAAEGETAMAQAPQGTAAESPEPTPEPTAAPDKPADAVQPEPKPDGT